MKSMKNIKKPSYAVSLGKGVFMGGTYGWFQCSKCGKRVQFMSADGKVPPPPNFQGKCPESSSGNHVYVAV